MTIDAKQWETDWKVFHECIKISDFSYILDMNVYRCWIMKSWQKYLIDALYGLDAETRRYAELSVYLSGVLNKIVTRTML